VRAHDRIPEDLQHANGNVVDTIDAVDTVSMKLPDAPKFPMDAMPEGCQKLVIPFRSIDVIESPPPPLPTMCSR
jgi:hypothetical protein